MPIASRDFRELRLEGVSRDFGQHHALRDVNLTVKRGEFVALLGPSGCGKSTALNCISGLLQVTGGAIWLDDTRLDEVGPEDRGFGMVFQNYALFPHLTVRRNVAFGLVTQRRPKAEIERRVDEALALVRLNSQGDALLLAARELVRVAVGVLADADEVEHLLDAVGRLAAAAELHAELDVLPGGQMGEQTVGLKDHSHVAAVGR